MSTAGTAENVEQPFAVLMCGLPGRMGHSVAELFVQRWGPEALLPFALTGADVSSSSVDVAGKGTVQLLRPETRDAEWSRVEEAAAGRLIIAADYTHPSVAVKNALFYRSKNVPFVMGTTGYDIDECKLAIGDELYAVLAPNMGKPIVLFQAMLKHAAEVYPGALSGFELSVVESHQKGKADTSGTAKAVVASLAELTAAPFGVEDIEMVREPHEQMSRMGVPEEFVPGHAYHTYRLTSPDKTVALELQHNVCGRAVYAEGTADAVEFLAAQVHAQHPRRVWSMLDRVLLGAVCSEPPRSLAWPAQILKAGALA